MAETIRYSLVFAEDISWGTGSVEVELADGTIVALSKVQPYLQSPDGTLWRLTIDNSGIIEPVAV